MKDHRRRPRVFRPSGAAVGHRHVVLARVGGRRHRRAQRHDARERHAVVQAVVVLRPQAQHQVDERQVRRRSRRVPLVRAVARQKQVRGLRGRERPTHVVREVRGAARARDDHVRGRRAVHLVHQRGPRPFPRAGARPIRGLDERRGGDVRAERTQRVHRHVVRLAVLEVYDHRHGLPVHTRLVRVLPQQHGDVPGARHVQLQVQAHRVLRSQRRAQAPGAARREAQQGQRGEQRASGEARAHRASSSPGNGGNPVPRGRRGASGASPGSGRLQHPEAMQISSRRL